MTQTAEISSLIADVREQVLYLQELGVESFDVRLAEITVSRTVQMPPREIISDLRSEILNLKKDESLRTVESRPTGSRLASLPSLKNLSKRSEPSHQPRITTESLIVEKPTETLFIEAAPTLPEPTETIEQIRSEIGLDCTRCKLSTLGRSKVVNSTGNFNAELMFVGEAPGADEDEQGFPFVGRAGKLLTDIMMAIGFSRDDVFIGNINRCRPPGNRAPEPDETIACKPFLQREIAVVRPKVIVVLGATAAQNLLETKVPIGKLRGNFHDYLGTKVMPTFHPAYLLRDPHKKREVWEDMKMVREYLKAG